MNQIDSPKNEKLKIPQMKSKRLAGYEISLTKTVQIIQLFSLPRCLLLAALAFCAANASAQQLTWDPGITNDGPVIESGNGSWDLDNTTNLSWNNGAHNVSWTQTSTTAGTLGAIFSGPDAAAGTYQVSLDNGTQMAFTNLQILANGYVFTPAAAADSLFLNTGDTLYVADGKTVTFNNNFSTPNNNSGKFFQLGSTNIPVPAVMVINGNVGGDQIVFNGTNGATFLLGGNTAASVTTIDALVWQTNGTSTGANTWQVGRAVTGSFNNSKGTFILDGPSTVMNFTTSLQIERGGGNGTVIVQNGATMNVGTTVTSQQNIQIGSEAGNNAVGIFRMYGGTLNIGQVGSGTAIGEIWLNKSGSNPGSTAEFTQAGGVVNVWGGILIGASSGTFSGGTAAVTNSGGFLYIGSGGSVGISYGAGGHAPTNYVVFSGGTVGALASWNSSVPMTLATANGNITFQCADSGGSPWNIALSGVLTGPGGLYKTGSGILTLSGANNYAGATVVSNGTFKITPSLHPTNGAVTLDGSAGFPVATVSVTSPGQQWTLNGDLTYANGTVTADFNYNNFPPSTTVAPIQTSGSVNFTVAPQVTIEGGSIPAGKYPLIAYGGSVSGTLPTVTSFPGPSGYPGYLSNSVPNKTIYLVLAASPVNPSYIWSVNSGSWDFISKNWKQFGGVLTNYQDPDAVQFDDTAPGPFPITVTLNTTVNPSAVAVVTTNTYTFLGNGAIAGPGGITKSGLGKLTLSTTNTYSGGTTVQAGQLNINYGGDGVLNSAIGTGAWTNYFGAVIDNTSGQAVTLLTPIAQYWNDDWTFLGSANFNTGPGQVTLGSSIVELTVVSNKLAVGAGITDNGNAYALQKYGAGELDLDADSSFSGSLGLFGGTLGFGSGNCTGSGILTIDGGAIDNVSGSDLVLGSVASISIPIASGGTFTFVGSGNLDLGSATINVITGAPQYWNIVSNSLTIEGDLVTGNSSIIKIGNGDLIIAGNGVAKQFNLTVNQGEADFGRSTGVAVGNGSNGHGVIVQSNGVVVMLPSGNSSQIYNGFDIVPVLNAGGVMDLNGQAEIMDGLNITNAVLRSGASGETATLTINTNATAGSGVVTLSGTAQFDVPAVDGEMDANGTGILTGPGSLLKTGLGIVNLYLTNEYAGDTTISNGTLIVNYPGLATNSTINIETNSILGTNGVLTLNFAESETNTVGALILGGVSKAPGIYNATTDPIYISGSGSLQVIPPVTINPLPGPVQFSVAGNTLALSWPTNLGWILQNQTNSLSTGLSTNWSDVAGSDSITSTNVTISLTNSAVFFRLRHP